MSVKKTLQEIVLPIVTALIEKRFQYALKHREPNKTVKVYPPELSYKALAAQYGISPRTLNRWYTGETTTTRNTEARRAVSTDASKLLKASKAKLRRAGENLATQTASIKTHVETLKFAHGRPTWRVHTQGWNVDQITDFSQALRGDGYNFYFTIWNPQMYPDEEKSGGFISSGWLTIKEDVTRDGLKVWITRKWLSKGEIHAIVYSTPKGADEPETSGPKPKKPKPKKRGPYDPRTLH
jgi:AraC-like DNA-binding protein